MKLAPYACLGGNELANLPRVIAYGGCEFFDRACPCAALDDEVFDTPATDPAPWYDANYPESADFFGFLPESITLSPTATRSVSAVSGPGSFIGPERLSGRVVDVVGWMVAQNLEGMWWGEKWLTEALRGTPCTDCVTDTLELLAFCREPDELISLPDYSGDFRTLVCAACVDGPRFEEISDAPDYVVVQTQFQFVSQMPWLFLPALSELSGAALALATPLSAGLTTTQWMEGTFVIEVTATTDLTDLVITGRVSLDGDCPVSDPGTSVMPCFTYSIAEMKAGDRVLIDGRRRQASYIDASEKYPTSLLPHLDFSGPFVWPDAGLCTTVCTSLEVATGSATVDVDTYLRES